MLMRNALAYMDSETYIFLRFALSAIVLVPFMFKRLKEISLKVLAMGAAMGLCLGISFEFMVLALNFTKVSNTVFISNLSVIFVPLYSFVINRKRPTVAWVVSIVFIIPGLFFLGGGANFDFNIGDLLSFFSMLVVSVRIIITNKFVSNEDPFTLSILQIIFAALVGFLFWWVNGFPSFQINSNSIMILFLTGVIGTAITFVALNFAQRMVLPVHVTMILSTMPVFGVIGAAIIPDHNGICEPVTSDLIIGSILMTIGMISYEIINNCIERKLQDGCKLRRNCLS